MKEPLEDLVRRVDEDRWLSSRFAPGPVRKKLVGLYAFNYELAHVGESSSEPALGAIRLQFWADAIASIYEGGQAPAHPALKEIAKNYKTLPRDLFDALIDARKLDLEDSPFDTWSALDAYVDATSGGLMQLACKISAPQTELSGARASLVKAAGRAWGYTGLARAFPYWTARKRTFFPKSVRAHVALDEGALYSGATPDHAAASAVREVLDRATGALRDVRRYSPAATKEMFPAIGYATLVHSYIHNLSAAPHGIAEPPRGSLMGRQFKLVGAAARGSL